jgi:hypothetical protein
MYDIYVCIRSSKAFIMCRYLRITFGTLVSLKLHRMSGSLSVVVYK